MKNTPDIKRYLHYVAILTAGLFCSQILSFLQVYFSNMGMYEKISAIHGANYIIVPNLIVLETLKSMAAAFWGGLFFTLTAGAGLTILSLAAAMLWVKMFLQHRFFLILVAGFWLLGLVLTNINGFSPLVSAQFVVVPLVVFYLAFAWLTKAENTSTGNPKVKILAHVVCIVILAMMSTSRMNAATYSHIRDTFLLSGNIGIRLNNVYYTYTLYAAQAFKPLEQDILKTCRISTPSKETVSEKIKQELMFRDYLIVKTGIPCDLELQYDKTSMKMAHKGRLIIATTQKEFLENPGEILHYFSQQCDRFVFFRLFTFFSLLMVSGLCLYLMLYLLFRIPGFFLGRYFSGFSHPLAAIFCCTVAGVVILYLWHPDPPLGFKGKALEQALSSDLSDTRVAALKYIYTEKIDIGKIGIPDQILKSPVVLERYWLAKTLYWDRSALGYESNLALLEDPQINVSYIAFDALGQRKAVRSVRQVLKRIPTIEHWYVQFYAYKSLRRLGWQQTESP